MRLKEFSKIWIDIFTCLKIGIECNLKVWFLLSLAWIKDLWSGLIECKQSFQMFLRKFQCRRDLYLFWYTKIKSLCRVDFLLYWSYFDLIIRLVKDWTQKYNLFWMSSSFNPNELFRSIQNDKLQWNITPLK